jgi:hypothetical protein
VIVLRNASEEEMVLEFLKAEHSDHPLVANANFDDEEENRKRARLLDGRGYSSRERLFLGFPHDATWKFVRLSIKDFETLRYLNCTPWRTIAPSLRVLDGADHVRHGSLDPSVAIHGSKILAIADSIRSGHDLKAALILGDAGDGRMIIAEGNHRATAYALAEVDRPIIALLATAPSMAGWANGRWQ